MLSFNCQVCYHVLIFWYEQILPQSICSHYGLAIGASVAPLVRVLVWICFPVAYPISKVIGDSLIKCVNITWGLLQYIMWTGNFPLFQLLDYVLGHGQTALFRRAELKTLVTLHGNEVYQLCCLLSSKSIIQMFLCCEARPIMSLPIVYLSFYL